MKCNVTRVYLAAGVVWGTILAAALAFFIGGGLTGILWVFVFGDQEWPSWAGALITVVMILSASIGLMMGVFIGWRYPRRLDPKTTDRERECRKAFGLVLIGSLLIVGVWVSIQLRSYRTVTSVEEVGSGHLPGSSQRPGESDLDFYCRALLGQMPVEIDYHGNALGVVPELLVGEDRILLAVQGPYESVVHLGGEIVFTAALSARSQWEVGGCTVLPQEVGCGEETYFLACESPSRPGFIPEAPSVEAYVPSLMAGFSVKLRKGR